MLFIFITLLFVMMFVILGQRIVDVNTDKELKAIKDIKDRIYNEVLIANGVENGYKRSFKIQKTILGNPYNISMDPSGMLVLTFKGDSHTLFLPEPVVGGFCFNQSLDDYYYYDIAITKEADMVSVSSCFDCPYTYSFCYNADKNGWCDTLSAVGFFPGLNESCCTGHCLCCP